MERRWRFSFGDSIMALATSIRNTVRNLINNLGSTASLYVYGSATKTTNEEGDVSITSWGSATTIKVISSNNYKLRRLLEMQGEENNDGERVVLVRDDVTVAHRDRIDIGSEKYLVNEIKRIDPIEDQLIAQRLVLARNINY